MKYKLNHTSIDVEIATCIFCNGNVFSDVIMKIKKCLSRNENK